MELQHLKTFLSVADAGSLTRAAETLYLSQPAVSAQVKALEVELGLPLFRRAARGMELTAGGRELLDLARDVIHRADGITRMAERLRGDVTGTLRLGTTDCGYDLKLARMIGVTTDGHPDLDVRLVAGNSGQHVQGVLDHELDLAIVEGDVDDERLQAWRIGTSRIGVIGPAAWRDDLADAGWARLGEFPWIFQSPTCSYCVLLNRLNAEHRLQLKPQIQAEAYGEVKSLVAEGLALSFADLHDAAEWVEDGRLFIWPHYAYDMPVQLIASRSRTQEPAIARFAEVAQKVHAPTRRRKARTAGSVNGSAE
ncbi:MAG: LysR family transcriptional regulator [Planctomycetota bacterium]